jgi:hypothetical protein
MDVVRGNVRTVVAVIQEPGADPALAQVRQIRWKFPPYYLNPSYTAREMVKLVSKPEKISSWATR